MMWIQCNFKLYYFEIMYAHICEWLDGFYVFMNEWYLIDGGCGVRWRGWWRWKRYWGEEVLMQIKLWRLRYLGINPSTTTVVIREIGIVALYCQDEFWPVSVRTMELVESIWFGVGGWGMQLKEWYNRLGKQSGYWQAR